MIFIGVILNKLGMLHGWCLFWYILSIIASIDVKTYRRQEINMEKEDYKAKQKKYRDMNKYNVRMVWISKDLSQPLIKGRTYVKPKEEIKDAKIVKKVNNGI